MAIWQAENDKAILRIEVDEDCGSPREEFDNVGTMICWHRRYNLGDKHNYDEPYDFLFALAAEIVGDEEELENMLDEEEEPYEKLYQIINNSGKYVMLPVYMYEHSGIALSTSGFSCPWDSGQVGFVYTTVENAIDECGSIEKALECLKSEVEMYGQYVNGECYGYVLEDAKTGETIDSCWGFYGYDWNENGIAENIPDEYRDLVDALA